MARNVKLNILKLGVDISAYYPNFYGDMPDELPSGGTKTYTFNLDSAPALP